MAHTNRALTKRDIVLLHTPESSPIFDGLLAEVEQPTDWGALVTVRGVGVTVEGKRRQVTLHYRASWEEMDYIGPLPSSPEGRRGVTPSRPYPVGLNGKASKKETTGGVCKNCQGANLVRTGTCVTCQDCGENEGCG